MNRVTETSAQICTRRFTPLRFFCSLPTKQLSFFWWRTLLMCSTLQGENRSLFSRISSVAWGNIRNLPLPPVEPRFPQLGPSSCCKTKRGTRTVASLKLCAFLKAESAQSVPIWVIKELQTGRVSSKKDFISIMTFWRYSDTYGPFSSN